VRVFSISKIKTYSDVFNLQKTDVSGGQKRELKQSGTSQWFENYESRGFLLLQQTTMFAYIKIDPEHIMEHFGDTKTSKVLTIAQTPTTSHANQNLINSLPSRQASKPPAHPPASPFIPICFCWEILRVKNPLAGKCSDIQIMFSRFDVLIEVGEHLLNGSLALCGARLSIFTKFYFKLSILNKTKEWEIESRNRKQFVWEELIETPILECGGLESVLRLGGTLFKNLKLNSTNWKFKK